MADSCCDCFAVFCGLSLCCICCADSCGPRPGFTSGRKYVDDTEMGEIGMSSVDLGEPPKRATFRWPWKNWHSKDDEAFVEQVTRDAEVQRQQRERDSTQSSEAGGLSGQLPHARSQSTGGQGVDRAVVDVQPMPSKLMEHERKSSSAATPVP